jgi:hypothetical protein
VKVLPRSAPSLIGHDGPTVHLHEPLHHGEPDSQASVARSGLRERIEDRPQVFALDPPPSSGRCDRLAVVALER